MSVESPPGTLRSAEPQGEVPGLIARRGFLKTVGLGAATLLVMGDGVIAYRAYDQGVLSEGRGPAFRAVEDWQTYDGPLGAVAAAVLAASAHNTQPWAFAVSEDRIDVFADPRRTTGANDALDREFHISLGCALENLVLGAHASGYATEVALDPGGEVDLVATVALNPAPPRTTQLYGAIGTRRSNRSEYRSEPVPAGTFADMAALVDASVSPAQLMFLDQDPGRGEFGDLLIEATRAHIADEEQSLASFAWWRNSWDEVQQHKDGLTIDGVGLPRVVRALGKLLPASTRASGDETFVDLTITQARSAAAFGVITVDDPAALGQQLAGGRLLQRLHLWASAHDLGFQHMNQVTERIDRDRQQSAEGVFDARLAGLVGGTALTAFRIGYPTVPSVPSPRRPVEEVLR
jgi:nitroreductase